MQESQTRCAAASADLRQTLGREPSPREVAASVGAGEADASEAARAHAFYTLGTIDGEPELLLGGHLGEVDSGYCTAEARATLARGLEALSDQERRVVGMRFYLGLTQREIAEEIGTTQMQVSRILTRVFAGLRVALEEKGAA